MGELILPIINISEGILTLYSIPKYFPFFIQILLELNNISRSLSIYIPSIKTTLFSLLASKEFFKKKTNTKPKAFDFDIHIKVQKEYIVTNAFWNSAFNEILDLIVEFLAIHSKKIYFPELTNFIVFNLKKLQKKFTFNYYKMKIKLILQEIHENQEKVLTKRKDFKKPVAKKTECLNFESSKGKTSLEDLYERSYQEKENLRKQKILAEKEGEDDDEEEKSEEEDLRDEENNDEDLERPLSEEELDFE